MKKTLFIAAAELGPCVTLINNKTFKSLSETDGLQIVLVTAPHLREVFTREFAHLRVRVETCAVPRPGLFERALAFFARNGFLSGTHRIMQHRALISGESRTPVWVKSAVALVVGSVQPLRSLLRALDLSIAPAPDVARLFDEYKPDLVFSTIALRESVDIPLLREARRRGVHTIGMVRSWDNLTTYGYMRILPDSFLAQNDFLREGAIRLHDVPASRITVVGTPAFDIYANRELIVPRDQFCSRVGINPRKKIILYAAIGDFLFPKEQEVADVFENAIERGQIDAHCVVLFRPHPAFKSSLERIRTMRHVVSDDSRREEDSRTNASKDHASHLVNSIYHAAVLVTAGSTMMIEGALLDKPVISVAFDGLSKQQYWLSIARFHEQAVHVTDVLQTGGATAVRSLSELAAAVNEAIAQPELRASERKILVKRFAGPNLGSAGEKISAILRDALLR